MSSSKYIGCSGFSERSWKGVFYPEDLPAKEYLMFYSQELRAVEINSTFYRRPTLKTLEKWYSETQPDFRFFIKIPKTVTHIARLDDIHLQVQDFCDHIASGLQDKLAGFLFQLPPSFQYTPGNLDKLLEAVDGRYLNVAEFRHASWWEQEIQQKLGQESIIFSGVSIPGHIPDDFIINTATTAYYRLHGNPVIFQSEYPESFLRGLADRAEEFAGTTYIFFNNTYGTAGIKNALFLDRINVEKQSNL